MALLDQIKQGPQGGPQSPAPGGDMSDVDRAVQEAVGSGQMQDPAMGGMPGGQRSGPRRQMASDQEHQKLKTILDSMEMAIHGKASDKVLDLITGPQEPFEGISSAAHVLTLSAYMKANKDGLEVTPDIFLAENGVVQKTVEMLWEVAEAADVVDMEDEDQLSAAYLNTIRQLGETMLEQENPAAVKSAQELLVAMETGEEVDASELFREEAGGAPDQDMGRMLRGGQGMPAPGPQRPSQGPQMPPQGGMPPMRRG